MVNTGQRHGVTIISNNLSSGGALAALSLARALEAHFDVHIIGTTFGPGLWAGLEDVALEIDAFPGKPLPAYFLLMQRMMKRIRGDIVLAHQLRLSSFGVAMLSKLRRHTPCALYIDDDDLALTMPGRSSRLRDRLRAPIGDIPTRFIHRLRGQADAVFCGSDYFSHRFDGITVPLGRDAGQYDPDRSDRNEVRERLTIRTQQTVIGFFGNPRPHVGIEDLVSALELIDDPDVVLLVVPAGSLSNYARDLFENTRTATVRVLENQPSKEVPAYLGASDIVVAPQRTEAYSLGQLPARLVEAMAMAKPIVTTRLADIPEILADAAIFVDERAPSQIADAIRRIRDNPEAAIEMGKRGRAAFLKRLTFDAMADRLVPPLEALARRCRGRTA